MHANKGDRIVVESVTIDSARPSGKHLPNPQQQSFDELATLRASKRGECRSGHRCGPGFTAHSVGGRATGPDQASRTLYVSTTISASSLS